MSVRGRSYCFAPIRITEAAAERDSVRDSFVAEAVARHLVPRGSLFVRSSIAHRPAQMPALHGRQLFRLWGTFDSDSAADTAHIPMTPYFSVYR